MESELVEIGRQLQIAESRAEAEARATAELRVTAPAILELLTAMSARLAALEQTNATLTAMVMATRIRRPIRDASGAIQYVVDELAPPAGVAAMIEE